MAITTTSDLLVLGSASGNGGEGTRDHYGVDVVGEDSDDFTASDDADIDDSTPNNFTASHSAETRQMNVGVLGPFDYDDIMEDIVADINRLSNIFVDSKSYSLDSTIPTANVYRHANGSIASSGKDLANSGNENNECQHTNNIDDPEQVSGRMQELDISNRLTIPLPNESESFGCQYTNNMDDPKRVSHRMQELDISNGLIIALPSASESFGDCNSPASNMWEIKNMQAIPEKKCTYCGVKETPQWRNGPRGILCNACGMQRYKTGRLGPEYSPTASPTFTPAHHSYSNTRVVGMSIKDMQRDIASIYGDYNPQAAIQHGDYDLPEKTVRKEKNTPNGDYYLPAKTVRKEKNTPNGDYYLPAKTVRKEKYTAVIRVRKCTQCGITKTRKWRPGPKGPKTLCSDCNLSAHTKKKKKSMVVNPLMKCVHCEVTETPQWRAGPSGPKTLCNACGVRYKSGRLFPQYRPAASPTFNPAHHSNSHQKVVKMHREVACESVASPTYLPSMPLPENPDATEHNDLQFICTTG